MYKKWLNKTVLNQRRGSIPEIWTLWSLKDQRSRSIGRRICFKPTFYLQRCASDRAWRFLNVMLPDLRLLLRQQVATGPAAGKLQKYLTKYSERSDAQRCSLYFAPIKRGNPHLSARHHKGKFRFCTSLRSLTNHVLCSYMNVVKREVLEMSILQGRLREFLSYNGKTVTIGCREFVELSRLVLKYYIALEQMMPHSRTA